MVVTPYTSRWFSLLTLKDPLLFCVCNGLDEKYMDLKKGDIVLVSRWRKYVCIHVCLTVCACLCVVYLCTVYCACVCILRSMQMTA